MRRNAIALGAGGFVNRKMMTIAAMGLAAHMAFPTETGRSDIAAYLAGLNSGGANMLLTRSPAGSIQQANVVYTDPMQTGSIAGSAGLSLPDGTKVALSNEAKGGDATPDEARVTRNLKKSRILAIIPVAPPKAFSAGSILDRTSFNFKPVSKLDTELAFVKPKITGKELQIAGTFYVKKAPQSVDDSVPTEIAGLVNNRRADILATAYASSGPDYARVSPFDSILNQNADDGRFVPEIGPKDHPWAATPLPAIVFTAEEQDCLTRGIYFEARGEEVKGQAAVAQVILNRVRNPAYPKTICGVVYQNEDWKNRCQFSFACDNFLDRILNRDSWKIAKDVAMAVTAGKIWLPEVGSATHYHATYVHPAWARTMIRVARIGDHIFYRTRYGGWS
ncbi:Cell wall hydrolase CwlJ, involved in spore germination [Ensifer adhaerens]|nr:Cell wall hydrolase CwlJ, involved in spore germination [Ensifer adhaerens]